MYKIILVLMVLINSGMLIGKTLEFDTKELIQDLPKMSQAYTVLSSEVINNTKQIVINRNFAD